MRRPSSRRHRSRRQRESLFSRRQPQSLGRSLHVETLEDRRLLSVASGLEMDADEAIQLFSTSTALFVENQGQWADEEVRYGFNGDGVNIAFTDDGLAFYLSQREAIGEAASELDGLQPVLDTGLLDRFDGPDDTITHDPFYRSVRRRECCDPGRTGSGRDAVQLFCRGRGHPPIERRRLRDGRL